MCKVLNETAQLLLTTAILGYIGFRLRFGESIEGIDENSPALETDDRLATLAGTLVRQIIRCRIRGLLANSMAYPGRFAMLLHESGGYKQRLLDFMKADWEAFLAMKEKARRKMSAARGWLFS